MLRRDIHNQPPRAVKCKSRASARRLPKPVVARYKRRPAHLFPRRRGLRQPGHLRYLEAEGVKYAIRRPANRVPQEGFGHLLTRPVGRPPNEVRRSYANFTYQAGSWSKPRLVVAKVEWHPGELDPRVGFVATDGRAETVVAFYKKSGTCEQYNKEGKGAIKWTRLSYRSFDARACKVVGFVTLTGALGNFRCLVGNLDRGA